MKKIDLNIGKDRYVIVFKRIFAYIIDIFIYLPLSFLFMFFSRVYAFQNDTTISLFMLICLFIVTIILFAYIPKKLGGQTIGKKIMGIKIQHNIKGNEISYWKYFLREYFAKIGLGILIIPMTFIYSIYILISKKSFPKTFLLDDLFSVMIVDIKKQKQA